MAGGATNEEAEIGWGARRAASGVAKAALLGVLIGMLLASSVAMVSAARTLDITAEDG